MNFFDRYLSGIGIDLSEHHIRIAHLSLLGGVKRLEEIKLEQGFLVDERVEKPKELSELLRKELAKRSLLTSMRATLLIPESRVFSSHFFLDRLVKGEEVSQAAIPIAQRQIPLPFSQASVTVSQGEKESEGVRTTVYAVEKQVLKDFVSLIPTELSRIAAEANTKALLRFYQTLKKPVSDGVDTRALIGIVDVGNSWTTIALYSPIGSSLFSRTFSYHSKTGLVDRISGSLQDIDVYLKTIQRKIGIVLFSGVEGADAELFGKVKEQAASLVMQMIGDVVSTPGVSKKDAHTFGAAIGAALRSIHPRKFSYQHNLLRSYDTK